MRFGTARNQHLAAYYFSACDASIFETSIVAEQSKKNPRPLSLNITQDYYQD
jgi:hypothetical protein